MHFTVHDNTWRGGSIVSLRICTGFADHKESIQVAYDQRQWGKHWPVDDHCPGFRDEALAFMRKCDSVVHKLLECFALALGMPAEDFQKVPSRHIAIASF